MGTRVWEYTHTLGISTHVGVQTMKGNTDGTKTFTFPLRTQLLYTEVEIRSTTQPQPQKIFIIVQN